MLIITARSKGYIGHILSGGDLKARTCHFLNKVLERGWCSELIYVKRNKA